MPFNSLTDRTDSAALVPEDVSKEILGNIEEKSVVMSLANRMPDMSSKQRRIPMWGTQPIAYFVSGDTGRKQTTEVSWDNVFLTAEEIAVIVPIPDNVVDDVDYDIWGQMKGPVETAIGKAFDQAVLYGINAPATWPECIVEGAEAAGHEVALGSRGDLYADLMGINGVLDLVESDGYSVTGHVAAPGFKARLRSVRDDNNLPMFTSALMSSGKTEYALDGEPILFPRNGAIDKARTFLISGDWSQLHFAIRKDIEFKMFTEGVISDDSGVVVLNLMQQDTSAMRVVFRAGWVLPNPANFINPTAATRYPFAFLEPVAAS